MLLTFLIPVYVGLISFMNERIPKATYPVAILMIGLSILLIAPLRGEYMIISADADSEYHFFYLTMIKWLSLI